MIRKFSGDTIGLQTFLLHCFGKSLSIQPSTVSASVKFSSWPQCRMHLQEGFNGSSASKESTCNAGDPGSIPGSGRSPREHGTPVFLPGESPWAEEAGGLQSMRLQRGGHDWGTKHKIHLEEKALPLRSPTISLQAIHCLYFSRNLVDKEIYFLQKKLCFFPKCVLAVTESQCRWWSNFLNQWIMAGEQVIDRDQ